MGASTFWTKGKGPTAKEAFQAILEWARIDQHEIGTKTSFTLIPVPAGQNPEDFASNLLDSDDRRVSDKWGPAGCVALGQDNWLFFGWAPE